MTKRIKNTIAVTEKLAAFISDTRPEDIPDAVRKRAAVAFLDWLGVTLAAVENEASGILRNSVIQFSGPSQANVLGVNQRVDAVSAAMINGFTSHLLDFDDVDMQWIGHPGVTVFPAVLAAAQWHGTTGKEMLDSYIIGTQVQNRIGRALMPDHYERGHHSTATIGIFGAAAGVSYLLHLNADQAATALGIAGTQSAGLRLMFGTMCKPLHPGRAAANGLMAAVLAGNNFTAAKNVIESPGGFAEVLSSDFNPESALENLLSEWSVNAIEFKEYASCRSTHGTINCILAARPKLFKSIENISSIEFKIADLAFRIAKLKNPSTSLEAKFSQHYCAAVALLDGNVGLTQFDQQRITDPKVFDLMKKIDVTGDKKIIYGNAYVMVTFKSGEKTEFLYISDQPGGVDGEARRVCKKFRDLLNESGMQISNIDQLIEKILGIGGESHINNLVDALPTNH